MAYQDLLLVLHGQRPRQIPIDYHGDSRYGQDAYTMIVHEGGCAPERGGTDLWGVYWAITDKSLCFPVYHPAETLEKALAMPFPDIDRPALWEAARNQSSAARGYLVRIAFLFYTMWERLQLLVGMEPALVGLVKQPDLVSAILGRITEWQIKCATRFIELGIDAARIADDYGTQADLMMSPNRWRQVIRPHLARLVEVYHRSGIPVILHSCGNLGRIMDDLVDLGFASFNIQTNANDLLALRKRYGRRFCVWGGVSTHLLSHGTPNQVRDAVHWAVENLGQYGGLVLAPDQYLPVPDENLTAFYQAAHEFRSLTVQ